MKEPAVAGKSYVVSGRHAVAGVEPGKQITDEAILAAGGSVEHLLEAGHLSDKAAKAVKDEE